MDTYWSGTKNQPFFQHFLTIGHKCKFHLRFRVSLSANRSSRKVASLTERLSIMIGESSDCLVMVVLLIIHSKILLMTLKRLMGQYCDRDECSPAFFKKGTLLTSCTDFFRKQLNFFCQHCQAHLLLGFYLNW